MKKLLIIILILSINQVFSQSITDKSLVGVWEVNEVNLDLKVFKNIDINKIDSIYSFFQTVKFAFSKNGLVKVEADNVVSKPFNNDMFNKVLYCNIENNIINIGSRKKSSNILYIQAKQENDFLHFNFIGARLKLVKTKNTCKLKIDKNLIQLTKTLLFNKPLTYVEINEDEIISELKDELINTYNCTHLKDKVLLKRCVSHTISWFFNRKFNTDVASNIGLSGRIENKIYFIIDKEGNVVNISVESKNSELSDEIKRTINLLPRFIPAKQNGENVNSKYSFPFIFHIQD